MCAQGQRAYNVTLKCFFFCFFFFFLGPLLKKMIVNFQQKIKGTDTTKFYMFSGVSQFSNLCLFSIKSHINLTIYKVFLQLRGK